MIGLSPFAKIYPQYLNCKSLPVKRLCSTTVYGDKRVTMKMCSLMGQVIFATVQTQSALSSSQVTVLSP